MNFIENEDVLFLMGPDFSEDVFEALIPTRKAIFIVDQVGAVKIDDLLSLEIRIIPPLYRCGKRFGCLCLSHAGLANEHGVHFRTPMIAKEGLCHLVEDCAPP